MEKIRTKFKKKSVQKVEMQVHHLVAVSWKNKNTKKLH